MRPVASPSLLIEGARSAPLLRKMAKATSRFVCQACGAVHPRWSGKCDACGAWNTIAEEAVEAMAPKSVAGGGRRLELVPLAGVPSGAVRFLCGIAEFDRVSGGGLVPGSATLVGGDPGIGKSTLLLHVAARLSDQGRALYISGEEAVDQIRMRAQRMDIGAAPVELAAATGVRDIVATLDASDAPLLAVIDSIQTMYVDTLDSAPGTVGQVRAAAQELIRIAKRRGTALLLVGHVTKEGMVAGPRVLEHMVDTVLYFEGERSHQFRILRSVKNRFGPTDEIGVFEMTERGLLEVGNPSLLFLGDRDDGKPVSGAAIFAGIEGTRPLLVEIQALVVPTAFGVPRRAAVGWDAARLSMVLAVLEARCGVPFAGKDIYLNVAGGLRIQEPAADLAVAAALLSSLHDCPLPVRAVIFGEIGLSGEVRPVSHLESRLKEAAKLGFEQGYVPRQRKRGSERGDAGLKLAEIGHVADLLALFAGVKQHGLKRERTS